MIPASRLFPTLLAVASLLSGCGDGSSPSAKPALRFTAIPGDNVTELQQKFAPFEKHLSERLGVGVTYVPTADYAASVDAFVKGDVELAWFGGLTGVRARLAVPGAAAIAQGKADPEYLSYFIAHRDTGLSKSDAFPAALAGRKFTFGSESSTSGRLMPEYYIRKSSGKTPAEFFGREMAFSGSHEKTAQLVQAGTFEAGAIDFKTYDRLVAEKKVDPELCRVIWTTPPYPDYHWTAHPSLDSRFGAGFTEKLTKILLEMHDPALLRAINRPEGLIPARNEEWDVLRETARELGLVR